MSNAQRKPTPDPRIAQKAQMLITILGNDFTRKSSHPFFRKLTETAAQPDQIKQPQPDISRALKNLMMHLAKNTEASPKRHVPEVAKKAASAEQYLSPTQHPALIASAIAKMESEQRRAALKQLDGKLAYRVMVYVREIEERARSRVSYSMENESPAETALPS
jgi:hypothetical protein